MMVAGFHRAVKGRFFKKMLFSDCGNSVNFGMRPSAGPVPPLTDDPVVVNYNGSHHGIGCRKPQPESG